MIVNGNTSAEWQYVRMTSNHYNSAAIEDPTSAAIRCFEDPTRKQSSIASVAAGSTVGFKSSNIIGHPGPVLWYLAKVPSGQSASSWKGDGNVWFKFQEKGATTDATGVHFETGMTKLTAKIPQSLSSGEYLVRVEHIALHKPGNPQHYVACGQLKVTGGSGSAQPSALVAFPGAYRKSDPGLAFNMYGSPQIIYTPRPPVFKG
ncbi:cellulose-growth-specific protein [Tothia fuscella]|uniref:lytic cellulose monooxygenase (C4-dehydrogenating) n=1 Tax=Tothia fuscella TaxID=1048955 RepID=A0A9P4TV70_9PEZI|nr:cellulose-growth-specific protein [Tothia fuscella]